MDGHGSSCLDLDFAQIFDWLGIGLAGERFPKESQSCMTDLRRIGWRFLDF
jgi:hypothetical protein